MIRSLYRFLLRLHPPAFRRRFSEEMLWIFDETQSARRGTASLFTDGLGSLTRQWMMRTEVTPLPRPSPPPGSLAWQYIDTGGFRLSRARWLQGAVISAILFVAASWSATHGTGKPFRRSAAMARMSFAPPTPHAAAAMRPKSVESAKPAPPRIRIPDTVINVVARVDDVFPLTNRADLITVRFQRPSEGVVKQDEYLVDAVTNTAALMLIQLDRNWDGRITIEERSGEPGRRFQMLLNSADRNKDGVVTAAELIDEIRLRLTRP